MAGRLTVFADDAAAETPSLSAMVARIGITAASRMEDWLGNGRMGAAT